MFSVIRFTPGNVSDIRPPDVLIEAFGLIADRGFDATDFTLPSLRLAQHAAASHA